MVEYTGKTTGVPHDMKNALGAYKYIGHKKCIYGTWKCGTNFPIYMQIKSHGIDHISLIAHGTVLGDWADWIGKVTLTRLTGKIF